MAITGEMILNKGPRWLHLPQQLYLVLLVKTEEEPRSKVEACEEDSNGLEAWRILNSTISPGIGANAAKPNSSC